MRYFFEDQKKIQRKLTKAKCLLVFDFDGTLSEIAETPDKAFLENSTKSLLDKIKNHFYLAVVSGRALLSVKQKVGLSSITYAGNHGFEWQIEREKQSKMKISPYVQKSLSSVKEKFIGLKSIYPGLIAEDKPFSIVLHYRNLPQGKMSKFKDSVEKIISFVEAEKVLDVIKGKKAIEVRPKMNWNKGYFVKFLQKYFEEKDKRPLLVVYIGDDTTDEDAFYALRHKGITIRIGSSNKSYAKYFMERKELNNFLSWLLLSFRAV